MNSPKTPKQISQSLELAILLESSAHKPGNVNVVTDFENTRYEHFLASAVAATSSLETGAQRGIEFTKEKITIDEVRVGEIIKNCVSEIAAWQHGGNTLLGTVILLSPMAVAAGIIAKTEKFSVAELRNKMRLVSETTTPQDATDVYDAIAVANPSGLGNAPTLDVNDPRSKRKILEDKIPLYDVFKIAEPYDTVCSEYVNNFHVTFDLAYRALTVHLKNVNDPGTAIIQSFLEVLAQVPDTFIARKTSLEKAVEVSRRAAEILDAGGTTSPEGRKKLRNFDLALRKQSNLLNPGTTADIIAAGLAVCILVGYRP